ncbi:MAG: alpha-2,8-polysialyltransferase family protein [Ignavibacteriaceae bacterium]|nr:alpha-2,8-polysialyltransferase family protein [Ignavibacteriaceae bacterium]
MALDYHKRYDVTVISHAENISKACEFLNVDYLQHKMFEQHEFILNPKDVISEVKRILEKIGDCEFHYSHTQFAIFSFILVTQLNKSGKSTIFHNFEFVYPASNLKHVFSPYYLRSKVINVLLKWRYKIPIELRVAGKRAFIQSLNLGYIKQHRCINDKDSYYATITEMYLNYNINFAEIPVLFIAQTLNASDLIDSKKINRILSLINIKNVYVKHHPKHGPIKGLENCISVPDFLPVELMFNKVKSIVVSFHSAALITAARFPLIKAVSLIDLVGKGSPFLLSVKKDMICKSDDKILFPSTIEEFKVLLYESMEAP